MKIIVDEMPETPRDCLFSEEKRLGDNFTGYICTLRFDIPGKKPKNTQCLCKDTKFCECLQELGKQQI